MDSRECMLDYLRYVVVEVVAESTTVAVCLGLAVSVARPPPQPPSRPTWNGVLQQAGRTWGGGEGVASGGAQPEPRLSWQLWAKM